MRRIVGALSALVAAVGLGLASAPAAHAAYTTDHASHSPAGRSLTVAVAGHQVGTGNQYVTDRIDFACTAGCAGSLATFYGIDIQLKGSAGNVLWSKTNFSVLNGAVLSYWPNRQHGKGAYWEISYGNIDMNPDYYFWESHEVVPGGAGSHPAGFGSHIA